LAETWGVLRIFLLGFEDAAKKSSLMLVVER
jgi:hypothetical protein